MEQETRNLQKAKGMVPLIRSIAREVRDRSREVERLEAELEGLISGPGSPIHEIRRVEADLFLHRREMERVRKELGRIGCSIDPDRPDRIVYSVADHEVSFEDRLDETGFRPGRSGSKS